MNLADPAVQQALTRLGSIVVTGPVALVFAAVLVRVAGRPTALRFALPVAATFVTIVVLKTLFRATGGAFTGTPFALSAGAPSGHMGMSVVVYGGLALMLLRRRRNTLSAAVAVFTLLALIAIAITRVTLHAHLPADVAAGLLIGGLCALWIGRTVCLRSLNARQVAWLLAAAAATIVVTHLSGLSVNSAHII